jgi:hypothetical protein
MADVNVELGLDAEGALRSIEQFSKEASERLKHVEFAALTEVALHAVELIKEGISKIVEVFAEPIREANEFDKSLIRLGNAMRAAGDYSQHNVEVFEKLAEHIARTTKFTEEQAIASFSLAKNFNTTNTEAGRLVEAAVKLAKATGRDLPEATELLGRTLDGTAGRLNKLVPGISRLSSEQLVAGGAIQFVIDRFNVASNDALPTYSGVINELSKRQAELTKELGNSVVKNQVVIQAIKGLGNIYFDLREQISGNKDAIRDWISNGVIIAVNSLGILSESLRVVDTVITRMRQGFVLVTSPLRNLSETMKKIGELDDKLVTRGESFDKVSQGLADLQAQLQNTNAIQQQVTKSNDEQAASFDNLTPRVARFSKELINQFKALEERIKNLGGDEIQTLQNQLAAELVIIGKAIQSKVTTVAHGEELIFRLQQVYGQKIADANTKRREEELAATEEFFRKHQELLQRAVQNPLGAEFEGNSNLAGLTTNTQIGLARGVGGATAVLQGAQGAQNLLSGVAEAVGQAFLGIPGIGQLFSLLAQGPEKVKEMVKQFADAVPDIIVAVVDAIPAVIEAFADKLSDEHFITKLATALGKAAFLLGPQIALALVRGAGLMVGRLIEGAGQFIGKVIEGAGQFIGKLVEGIGKALDKINPLSGGGGFGLGGNKGLLGGGIVPGLFKTGSSFGLQPAFAPASSASFEKAGGGGSGGTVIHIPVMIDRKQIAEVMVDLDRYGYRTRA